ncbi:MucBP domain-containing protein, partial [Aerococcaceae bacterium zg-ZJ1578]|uniref:MucBP domain-containing protein n=1 Tax=Aerococcaceae bacterium zg-252 TaxID=2796928 RepID=UPI001A18ACCC|nr:MucBP domain-containing protein [Aerococcaceae bacterium zg-1578]
QPEAAEPKGSVVVHYVNEAGEKIQNPFNDTTDQPLNTPYNTEADDNEKPKEIAHGGKTYVFKEVSTTPKVGEKVVVTEDATNKFSDKTSGDELQEGTTHIVYVYSEKQPEAAEPKGSVVVHYVNEAGEKIQNPFNDTTDQPLNTPYNTEADENEKPKEIAHGGKTYVFKEVSTTPKVGEKVVVTEDATNKFSDKTSGDELQEGTTHIVYVYSEKQPEAAEPKGSVVVHYVNEAGEVIKTAYTDTTDAAVDSTYEVTGELEKPKEIIFTKEDGTKEVYERVRVSTTNKVGEKDVVPADAIVGGETGSVVEGTTNVIYVYKLKEEPKPDSPKGSVIVKYEDEEGNEIQDPKEDTPLSPVDTPYNTVDKRDEKIEVPNPNDPENPTVYHLTKNEPKEGEGEDDGKVKEGEKVVTYVYKKAGSVIVHYVDENGKEIAADQVAKKNEKDGTEYDTTTKKLRPTKIPVGDKVYELVPAGTYGVGEVDEDGHLTTTDAVDGSVEAGKTKKVTYVYRLVTPVTPESSGEEPTPPPVEEKPNKYIPYIPANPEDPSNPNDPKYPTDPEKNPPLYPNGNPIPPVNYDNTPEDPSDNPPLPDIDGYIPVDPQDPSTPLKPV